MEFVKLNAFQRIMRLWDEVHPYNAVQAFRLEGDADLTRIAAAWRATLKSTGLGRAVCKANEYCHTALAESDERGNLVVADPGTPLDRVLTNEMNVRMDPDDGCPFRLFVVPESGTHCIGVTYHHWVADSASIRWLLDQFFLNLRDLPGAGSRRAKIPAHGHWHFFGPDAEKWPLHEGFLEMLRNRTRFCRARQIAAPMGDCSVNVSLHTLPDGVIPKLAVTAHNKRIKVNDIMVATIAQAIDQFGANPATRDRDELAIGTIVDMRAMSSQKMEDIFGLFLGFTTTMLRPADLRSWSRLLGTVARQNAFHKRAKVPHSSILRMAFGLAEAKLVTPRRWAELYRSRMPIAAGISNVNMNRNWAGKHHPSPLLEYFRVAPTGPMLPMLVTPTTLGNKFHFLITRQTCLIDESQQQKIADSIRNRLIELAENVRSWDMA